MEGIFEDSSIVRRKRTKRQRLLLSSPVTADVVMSSSTSAEFFLITAEEEEYDANCLVLFDLAGHKPRDPEPKATEDTTTAMKFTNWQFAEAATTTRGKVGLDIYKCKTCNKCFPSFQALGGHRASHRKIKLSFPLASADKTKTVVMSEESIQLSLNSFSSQVEATARIHECSICGAKFPSGQALGGHMQRHRPVNPQEPAKKEGNSNGLSLDLNLPPPCDDDDDIAKSSSSV